MPSLSSEIVDSVQHLFRDGTGLGASDGQLLDRFSRQGDEAAFAILVERHGPMVLRVCRAILGDDDARDAFQATFLVLVRRLRWIDRRRSVAPWLFGVSQRIAVRTRADAARRRARERLVAEVRAADDRPSGAPSDSWAELYEELARLPEKYRAPLVLCHLEGCSTEQAAARLGCPRGTILSRLSRGREQLKKRLTRRGLAPLAAFLATDFTPNATPATAVPPALADATISAASQTISGAGLFAIKAAVSLATIGGLVAASLALGLQTPSPSAPASAALASAPEEVSRTLESAEEQTGIAFIPLKTENMALRGHKLAVFGAAFSPDGKILATCDAGAMFKLWDVATGRESASVTITPRQGGHAAIMAIDFSPDGKTLAMACDDQTIRLRDVATREEKLVLSRGYFPNTVKFSPDGMTLAWAVSNPGAPDGPKAEPPRYVVVLWDLAAGCERTALAGHTDGITRIAFSPDGKTIASASQDHTVRLWDAATGVMRRSLSSSPNTVYGLAFSPDGRTTATAGGDLHASDRTQPSNPGLVSIWDVGPRTSRSWRAHGDFAADVAFSPDGRFLASGGRDGLVTIRDAATGEERVGLNGRQGRIFDLAFSPDGKSLVSAGYTARLWRVGDLLESLTAPAKP